MGQLDREVEKLLTDATHLSRLLARDERTNESLSLMVTTAKRLRRTVTNVIRLAAASRDDEEVR